MSRDQRLVLSLDQDALGLARLLAQVARRGLSVREMGVDAMGEGRLRVSLVARGDPDQLRRLALSLRDQPHVLEVGA